MAKRKNLQPEVLVRIAARCDDVGECWLWTGALSDAGYPIFRPPGCGCMLVRRWVYANTGAALVARQPVVSTCGDRRCVNPDHLRVSTVALITQAAAARGAWSGVLRGARIAATKRLAGKLPPHGAHDIRTSADSARFMAAKYGVDVSLVYRIRNGTAQKQYGANPFAGLM